MEGLFLMSEVPLYSHHTNPSERYVAPHLMHTVEYDPFVKT